MANHPGELLAAESLQKTLEKLLVPIEEVAVRINQGLDATATETFSHVVGSKVRGDDHIELEHVDKVAWTERRKYAELHLKLRGLLKDRVEHEGEVTTHVKVTVTDVGG